MDVGEGELFDQMSSPPPVPPPPVPATAKPKRARKAKAAARSAEPKVIEGRYVCEYTGRLVPRAVFFPSLPEFAFCNLPSALAWAADSKPAAESAALAAEIVAAYGQVPDNVARAPPRNLLAAFGGSLSYEQWIGDLHFWDVHAEGSGKEPGAVPEQPQQGAPKRARGQPSVTFDAAMYTIAYNKGPAGCKKITAVSEADKEKGALTPVAAVRKLQTFLNANDSGTDRKLFERRLKLGDGWTALIIERTNEAAQPEVEKFYNNIASQLVGTQVFGPAVVFFTRKLKQKL